MGFALLERHDTIVPMNNSMKKNKFLYVYRKVKNGNSSDRFGGKGAYII